MENGITSATKDMQGLEIYIKGSIPLDLSENTLKTFTDIDKRALLIDANLEGALFGTGSKGKAPSLSGTVEDLKKAGLAGVIPNGFLLLHNDLQSLQGESSSEEDSSSEKTSFLKDFVKGFAGAAGVAAGAAAALALFNGGSGPSENLSNVIEAIDADLKPEDYINDPEVADTKRNAVLGYLKMYYTSQIAGLAGEAVGNAVAGAATALVTGTVGKLISFFSGEEETPDETSLQSIVSTLDSSMTLEELGLAEGGEYRETVIKEKRTATAAYLAAYYAGQVLGVAAEGVAGAVSDVAVELVGGTLKKLFNKVTSKEEDATSLEAIVQTLDSSMTLEELGLAEGGDHRETVVKEKRVATVAYLTAYYTGQVLSASGTAVASAVSDVAVELVGGTLKKLFNKITGKEDDATSLKSIVDALDKSMTMEELGLNKGGANRDRVTAIKNNAIIGYIKAYYAGQTASMVSKDVADTVAGSAGAAVKGFFKGLFGKKEKEAEKDPFLSSMNDIIEDLSSSITTANFKYGKNAAITEAVDESVSQYVAAFLDREKQALLDNLSDSELQAAAKSALSKIDIDLTPLASLAFSATSPESNVTINSMYDDRMLLTKLDTVITALELLSGNIQGSSGGLTVINNDNSLSILDEFRMST